MIDDVFVVVGVVVGNGEFVIVGIYVCYGVVGGVEVLV